MVHHALARRVARVASEQVFVRARSSDGSFWNRTRIGAMTVTGEVLPQPDTHLFGAVTYECMDNVSGEAHPQSRYPTLRVDFVVPGQLRRPPNELENFFGLSAPVPRDWYSTVPAVARQESGFCWDVSPLSYRLQYHYGAFHVMLLDLINKETDSARRSFLKVLFSRFRGFLSTRHQQADKMLEMYL